MTLNLFAQQLINGLEVGAIYAMIAVGLSLVYGVLRILHIAQAGIFTVGAYAGLFFFGKTGSISFSLPAAMIVAGILGLLIERFIYRPMLSRPRIVALIASIGLLISFSDLLRIVAGADQLAFDVPSLSGMYQIGSFNFSQTDIMIFAGTSIILAGLWFLLTRTKLGLAIRAAAQDIETSEIVGVNVRRSIAVVFFISSAIAAFGGVMVAILYDAVSPDMGNMIAYKGLALVVIGGFGSLPGAVVASLMLGLAETFATTYTSLPLSHEALAMLFLVALILIRPQGLMGKA